MVCFGNPACHACDAASAHLRRCCSTPASTGFPDSVRESATPILHLLRLQSSLITQRHHIRSVTTPRQHLHNSQKSQEPTQTYPLQAHPGRTLYPPQLPRCPSIPASPQHTPPARTQTQHTRRPGPNNKQQQQTTPNNQDNNAKRAQKTSGTTRGSKSLQRGKAMLLQGMCDTADDCKTVRCV
jgi:hypothetical protein